jgi:hypothetical protein
MTAIALAVLSVALALAAFLFTGHGPQSTTLDEIERRRHKVRALGPSDGMRRRGRG